MNNIEANKMMQEFLATMCPENYKAEFIKCLETNDAKKAEEIIDKITATLE